MINVAKRVQKLAEGMYQSASYLPDPYMRELLRAYATQFFLIVDLSGEDDPKMNADIRHMDEQGS